MKRGTVLFHTHFKFKNGKPGKKLLVVLNNQRGNHPYLMAKTTTQPKNKSRTPGCIVKEELFFIEGGKTCFPEDTWIQLYEVYPFSASEVLQDHFDGNLEIKGSLPTDIANAVKNCIKRLESIELKYKKMITKK
jgi:hypothetical protein